MKYNNILTDSIDSSKGDLTTIFMSNSLNCMVDMLIENIFSLKKDSTLRNIIITPSHTVNNFLTQQIINKIGSLFSIRFLTIDQAIKYFIKISNTLSPTFPSLLPLSFHIEQEIIKILKNPCEEAVELIDYISCEEDRIRSLSTELSKVFLSYGFYGKEVEAWEGKPEWQQLIWHQVKPKWTFPRNLTNLTLQTQIFQQVHIFDPTTIPRAYREFLEKLSNNIPIYYYFRSPTNPGITRQSLFNWLSQKKIYEKHITNNETTTLNKIKNDIYSVVKREHTADNSIEIHEVPNKLREIETLIDKLKEFHQKNELNIDDILVVAPDINKYFPYIKFIFESHSSPFGYKISGLCSLSQSSYIKALHLFFSLTESRFEPNLIIELVSFNEFKFHLDQEGVKLLKDIVEFLNVQWGYDINMKKEILKIDFISELGSWQYAFETLIKSLPYLHSPIELSKAELFGEIISLISDLKKDVWDLRNLKKSIKEWIVIFVNLIEKYFLFVDETVQIIDKLKQFIRYPFIDEPFSHQSIKKILDKIFIENGASCSYTNKPPITFASLSDGSVVDKKIIYMLGFDDENFPRRASSTSINQLKDNNSGDGEMGGQEKDRYLFLQAILSAQEKLVISFTGTSEDDGKQLPPSVVVNELMYYIKDIKIQKEMPFSFSKTYLQKEHYSQQNYELAKAYYCQNKLDISFEIATKECDNLKIDISHLIKLSRHPIQFFCNHSLGVYIKKNNDKKDKEFILSYLDKSVLVNKAIHQCSDEIIDNATINNQLPTAMLYKSAKYELTKEMKNVKQNLAALSLTQDDFISIKFDASCKTPFQLTKHTKVLPAIKFITEGGKNVIIYGDLPKMTKRGIYHSGSGGVEEMWRHLPHLIILANTDLDIPIDLLCAENGDVKQFYIEDMKNAISTYLEYYIEASNYTSPLMPNKIQHIMKGKDETIESPSFFEDPYLNFIKPDFNRNWERYVKKLCNHLTL